YLSEDATIRKYLAATGAVTTVVGVAKHVGNSDGAAADARFNFPAGLASDGAGNLYVADRNNHSVRKIVLQPGAVPPLAGGPVGPADGVGAAAQFRAPADLVFDGLGNLYVSDIEGYTIRKIVLATATVSTLAGSDKAGGNTDGVGTAARFRGPW